MPPDTAEQRPKPNVRVKIDLELYVPDVTHPEVEEKHGGTPGYEAYVMHQLDDDSHERVQAAIYETIEAGDPDDTYNFTISGVETSLIEIQ